MRNSYSAQSLTLSKFPICFETLSKVVKYSGAEINKAFRASPADMEPMELLKDLRISDFPIIIRFLEDKSIRSIHFTISTTILFVDTNGFEEKTSIEVQRIIQETLTLIEPTAEDERGFFSLGSINNLLWKVYDRVDEISKRQNITEAKDSKEIKCFVSFRFDDHSKALAFELREFMELVGLEFVSGLGFEPRSITEKVLERLSGPLDIFIILFSESGDSSWVNQEIGVARARKLPILVLKEEGADVDAGMLGDTEYLIFPRGNISKVFVGVLQALSYLKEKEKS